MSTTVKRTVTVISACMTAQGTPTFVPQALRVTAEEYENGLHYALAEDWLTDAGFDEPFVHFFCGVDGYVAFDGVHRPFPWQSAVGTPHN